MERGEVNKLSWRLQGVGAYGWRYRLTAILIKAFYHLHLISEQDAIEHAKGLHNMWMVEKAERAGLRIVKVDLGGEK